MARRRILMVSHNFTLTGAPIILMHLAHQLADRFEPLVVSPFEGPLRTHLLQRGINALVVVGLGNDVNVSAGLLLSYDILLANTLLSFVAVHAASQLGKPSVWWVHEGLAGSHFLQTYNPGMAAAMPLATRFVAPCSFVASLYASLRQGSTDVIPNGIEAPAAPPTPSSLVPGDRVRVLQLGSVEPRKGQDISCAAMRLVKNDRITLDIVGAVNDPAFGQSVASDCSGDPRIKMHGPADLNDVSRLIAQCDLLIAPSRDEVTPLVILEAMASGKPVIAAAVGGVPEMIEEGRTGFLVPPNDPVRLGALIERLGADWDLRRAIGGQGHAFVRSQRSLTQFGNRFADLFQAMTRG